MNILKLIAIPSAALLSGCLSIVRIPLPLHEQYSDDGACTNRVWEGLLDKRQDLRIYPTVKMRCAISAAWWAPIPADAKGEKLYKARQFKRWGWIPLACVWLTSPLDAAVDTLFLPYDFFATKNQRKEKP